jgi:hypothetical protein
LRASEIKFMRFILAHDFGNEGSDILLLKDVNTLVTELRFRVQQTKMAIELQTIASEYEIHGGQIADPVLQARLRTRFKRFYQGVQQENKCFALRQGRDILTEIDECERERYVLQNAKDVLPERSSNCLWLFRCGAPRTTHVASRTSTRSLSVINESEGVLHGRLAVSLATAQVELDQQLEYTRVDRSTAPTPVST